MYYLLNLFHQKALCSSTSLRSEQVVVSGVHDTRRPTQGSHRTARRGGLGEGTNPDTRAGVRGAAPFNGVVGREVAAVLNLLGVDRSHEAVLNWTHDLADAQSDPTTADPAAAFLHRLTEKHNVSDMEFLVDDSGYLARFGMS